MADDPVLSPIQVMARHRGSSNNGSAELQELRKAVAALTEQLAAERNESRLQSQLCREALTLLKENHINLPASAQAKAPGPRPSYRRYSTMEAVKVYNKPVKEVGITKHYEALFRALGQVRMSSSTEVRLKDYCFEIQTTVADKAFPTIYEALTGVFHACGSKKQSKSYYALNHVNAVFKPGKSYLILGPPKSGKSSLLKAVAGRLPPSGGNIKVSGDITYNGETTDSGNFEVLSLVSYVEQLDNNEPLLTVRETFEFAGICIGFLPPFELISTKLWAQMVQNLNITDQTKKKLLKGRKLYSLPVRRAFAKIQADRLLAVLGLEACADTIVGDAQIRGVSGGERKRVTLGEMLCGSCSIMCFDEISNGLDSAATHDICEMIQVVSRGFQSTSLVALQQPSPEVFHLFDELVLMRGGAIIYQGPTGQALQYFTSLGFRCPPSMDAADFFLSLAAGEARQHVMDETDLEEMGLSPSGVPHSTQGLVEAFNRSAHYKVISDCLQAPHPEHEWRDVEMIRYKNTWLTTFKVVLRRELMLLAREKSKLYARMGQNIILGLVIGSLFWRLGPTQYQSRFGLIFGAMMAAAMKTNSQMPTFFEHRSVYYKQHQAGFYSASCYALAGLLGMVPPIIIDLCTFCPLVYFMTNATTSNHGAHFGLFLVISAVLTITAGQFFRLLCYVTPNNVAAQGLAGLCLLFMVVFSGYIVPQSLVPDWWIWVMYLNPFYYGFQAMVSNEFRSARYDTLMADGRTLGEALLESKGMRTEPYWMWLGILIDLALLAVYTFAITAALAHIQFQSSGQPEEAQSDDKLDEPVASEHGSLVEGAPQGAGGDNSTTSALRFTPITLAFKDVCYTVTSKDGHTWDLLQGVSGFAAPGTMTALMGSSGAGKTTLLDVLAQRKTSGKITGDMAINGHPIEPDSYRRMIGYCEQQDLHSPFTTVEEAITFSAKLRLSGDIPLATKKASVEEVLKMLELVPIRHEIVGPVGSGLSNEQRKRLTIAVEMAANPSLIFLDEPTTGLDARSANMVVRVIRRLSNAGRTIICTIHQPSLAVFFSFDNLLLLKRGGKTVFFGALGPECSNLISHLQSIPETPTIEADENPATWMLTCIGAGTAGSESTDYASEYLKSGLYATNMEKIEPMLVPDDKVPKVEAPVLPNTWLTFRCCYERSILSYWRQPSYNVTRIVLSTVIGVIMASAYAEVDADTSTGMIGYLAISFKAMLFLGLLTQNTATPAMLQERSAFYREQATKMYPISAYALSWTIAELPYITVLVGLFMQGYYWLAGFSSDPARFFFYWLYMELYLMFCIYLGQALAILCANEEVAQLVSSTTAALIGLFAGFMISPSDMPEGWLFLWWGLPGHYAFEGLVMTQYHGADTQVSYTDPSSGQSFLIAQETFIQSIFGDYFSYDHRWVNVGILCGFIGAARIAFHLGLLYVRHETR